jgi:hypothetical protein
MLADLTYKTKPMEVKPAAEHSCAECALRKKAEAKPKSLLGRFWFWHIKWCPGWKSYQKTLAMEQ